MRFRLPSALWYVFALWTATWSGVFAALYVAGWLVTAPKGVQLVTFMNENSFASFYLVSFVTGLLYAAFVGAVVLWSRGKSARDYGPLERRIDEWMTRIGRSDRPG
jgi:hypothetical protein